MSKKNKKVPEIVSNGLTDVVMGGAFNPMATQVNQTDSLYINCRTYLISNQRQILSQSYVEHGPLRTLVQLPVDDAFRGGFKIKSSQLDEDEIKALKNHMDSMGDEETAKEAIKWNRLYGGAGIVIMTNQKHDTKLDVNKLEGMELKAVDMWELFSNIQNIEDDTRKLDIGKKKDFCFNFYGVNLHKSRVLVLKGITAPSFIRPRLRGWGLSIMEHVVSSINQFLKTKNLSFEVLDEFKLDIFKIKGFNQALLSAGGTEKIQKRVQLANMQKNYQNALAIDSEDEHQSKQLNFSGLSEVQKDIRIQLASDLRMPLSKLFGLSATGFNSGEDDIENYNGMIESEIRPIAKKTILEIAKLRCQEVYGMIPDDLEIELCPLRVMSLEQEENIKDKKFNRVVVALEKGLCSLKEAQESINRDNLLGVKVDVTENFDNDESKRMDDSADVKNVP